MVSRNDSGERVHFERLEAPRPAPKVTLKSKWQTQQQQQQPQQHLEEVAIWESRASVRDDKKQSMGVDQASRKWVQDASEIDIDTHRRKKEINTDTVLVREVVE